MTHNQLPDREEMVAAFLAADASYDGIFFTGVRTTGIFCRPSCSARKPNLENVEFFPRAQDALLSGFRPCKRCRPLVRPGSKPEWITPLLNQVDRDPLRRWRDSDLRTLGLTPERVRRWFKQELGMTFHAYSRARRLGEAIGQIKNGDGTVGAAYDAGFESLSGFNEALRQATGMTPRAAASSRMVTLTRIPTVLGPMVVGTSNDAVCLLEFADRRMLPTQIRRLHERLNCVFVPGDTPVCKQLRDELAEYFRGERSEFTVSMEAPGTEFQEAVWLALRSIPYGQTISYGMLAERLGRPDAVRAVARANGDNRIAILIPCHRVVGKDGKLTGYGGGLWRKRRLIDIENGVFSLDLDRVAPEDGDYETTILRETTR